MEFQNENNSCFILRQNRICYRVGSEEIDCCTFLFGPFWEASCPTKPPYELFHKEASCPTKPPYELFDIEAFHTLKRNLSTHSGLAILVKCRLGGGVQSLFIFFFICGPITKLGIKLSKALKILITSSLSCQNSSSFIYCLIWLEFCTRFNFWALILNLN